MSIVTGPWVLMRTPQVKRPLTIVNRPTCRGEGYGAKCHLIIPPSVMWKGERKPYILGDRVMCQPHLSTDSLCRILSQYLMYVLVKNLDWRPYGMSGMLPWLLRSLVFKEMKSKKMRNSKLPHWNTRHPSPLKRGSKLFHLGHLGIANTEAQYVISKKKKKLIELTYLIGILHKGLCVLLILTW